MIKDTNISVVIPTRNNKEKLRTCIRALLKSYFLIKEIIIIDNSSDDHTRRMVSKFKKSYPNLVFYYKEKTVGSYRCRNKGIIKAKGKILVFLDDDCIVSKKWISIVIKQITWHPDCAIMGKNINAYTDNIIAIVDDFRTRRFIEKNIYRKGNLVYSKYLDTKNFVIRKNLLVKNNLYFDEKFISAGDVDLGLRLNKKNIPILYSPQIVAYHCGVTSFFQLIKKEFKKGRARFIFDKKWNLGIKKSLKERLSLVNDLHNDEICGKKSFLTQLAIFFIILLCSLSYKAGYIFERIR